MTDFTTASLLAGRVEGETYASSHYARIAKALADASQAWKDLANATAFNSADVPLLKAKAMKATAYASTISGRL
jgi:hypothetical protein